MKFVCTDAGFLRGSFRVRARIGMSDGVLMV